MLKTRIAAPLVLATLLFGTVAVGPVSAQQGGPNQGTVGGAAGVVAAVVQALNNVQVNDNEVEIEVIDTNNSLNNLRALNNVLNNNDVDVTVQDVSVLSDNQIDILRNADIDVGALVGVVMLGGTPISSSSPNRRPRRRALGRRQAQG